VLARDNPRLQFLFYQRVTLEMKEND
jgi:hypothetical protein